MKIYLDGIGLLATGFAGWNAARAVLQRAAPYRAEPMARPNADILPAAERRRCGETVKLAVHVGNEAVAAAGVQPGALASVFTSSSGNGEVLHEICEGLAKPDRELSPTRFHNSVHNAPAGYWSIATSSREPSTSLCVYHGSFAAGLLEAALQATSGQRSVLLVACDTAHPEPLHTVCPVIAPFGVGMVIGVAASAKTCAMVDLALTSGGSVTTLTDSALEALRQGNAAARCLPLLEAVAMRRSATVLLEYLPGRHLAATVAPQGSA
jgi:hypothetical protein